MKHIYAFSDVHGCWEVFQQLLDFIQPEDRVICLGDCGDRGDDGWKIIETVLNDDRFIYLMGNHEKMLIDTVDSYYKIQHMNIGAEPDEIDFYLQSDLNFQLLRNNGGKKTFQDWKKASLKRAKIEQLRKLAYGAECINAKGQKIILTHAGFTPYLNRNIEKEEDYLIWNRTHFYEKWDEYFPDTIIVHGHTPILYLGDFMSDEKRDFNKIEGAYWYCNNHKVNIDKCTIITGELLLLDLDTWEEHIFRDNKIYCG